MCRAFCGAYDRPGLKKKGQGGGDIITGGAGDDVITLHFGPTDIVTDFKIGEDKIGILDFSMIEQLAKKNDGNYEEAKSTYLAALTERADEAGKTEIDLLLKDLGFRFQPLRVNSDIRPEGHGNERFWTLVNRMKTGSSDDDVMLLYFSKYGEDEFTSNPFLDETVETLFEFL